METSICAGIHTLCTHINKPAHVGFHVWLVRDNERLNPPAYCLVFEVISVNTKDIYLLPH